MTAHFARFRSPIPLRLRSANAYACSTAPCSPVIESRQQGAIGGQHGIPSERIFRVAHVAIAEWPHLDWGHRRRLEPAQARRVAILEPRSHRAQSADQLLLS